MKPFGHSSRDSRTTDGRRRIAPSGPWRLAQLTEDAAAWSVPVLRIMGVRVRIHVLLILLIAVEMARSTFLSHQETASGPAITATALLALFIVIFAHEIGKALMTRWMGGSAETIVLWPLGGLSEHQQPAAWRRRLIASLGGLLLSLVLASALWPLLMELTPNWYTTITHPLTPGESFGEWLLLAQGKPAWWALLVWWVGYANFIVLVANVLPVYPLDGAHALESVLTAMFGRRRGRSASIIIAMALALVIVFASLLVEQVTGVFLGGFAMLCCITMARRHAFFEQQAVEEPRPATLPAANLHAEDFDDVITRAPRSVSNLETTAFQVRLETSADTQKATQKRAVQSDRPATEEEVVDRILAKISTEGLAALSDHERKILESVTARRRRG